MLDFLEIRTEYDNRKHTLTVFPEFIVMTSKDLMIRGKTFYAIWDEEKGFWSKKEDDVKRLVDDEIMKYIKNLPEDPTRVVKAKLMRLYSSNQWVVWQKYCKSLPDNYHELDKKVVFNNSKIKKSDYVSRCLPYNLDRSSKCPLYDELMSTIYDKDERTKLEWAVGSILAGDSVKLQKFIVLYGPPGSGKSTFLKILEKMFVGYTIPFDAKSLTSSSNSFALEMFREDPLIAIQHDGDLSRIEDNTKLNSIVSHEKMVINEKFKAPYESTFYSFLFLGTNKPVHITDAKAGLIRRLIDVTPTGNTVPAKRYREIMRNIDSEIGSIARRCLNVYNEYGKDAYNGYIPTSMLVATNDIYNFVLENYDFFMYDNPEGVTLNECWLRYKEYCEFSNVPHMIPRRQFKIEMDDYFQECVPRYKNNRNFYMGFKSEKLDYKPDIERKPISNIWIKFESMDSIFDEVFKDCPAQNANDRGTPTKSWANCKTKLYDIDTSEVHYVKPPENLVVIDFDLKDEEGNKDSDLNIQAASKWPDTYAELSKSGSGIHLHYFYDGDVKELANLYDEDIEIKIFTGGSALRRCLTKCNNIPIATLIRGQLPLKEVKTKVINDYIVMTEKSIRELIKRNLRKEIHPNTAPSIDFIYKILDDAYNKGITYDVSDMMNDVQVFAMRSSHQVDHCLKMVSKMKFKSADVREDFMNEPESGAEKPIIFYDVEVFPNLFVIVWKKQGKENQKVVWINPSPSQVEDLVHNGRLVGFNNRRYDNHMLYARMMGYGEMDLFKLSQDIVANQNPNALFGEAYNLSYTDIYDFLSADHKMSLKKWEIKLGIHHSEWDHPWDKPVPEELWNKVGEYCCYDVDATEAVWDANQSDWMARQILSELSGLSVNSTTNQHTTKLIVGNDQNPQSQFIYTDLSEIFEGYEYNPFGIDQNRYNEGAKIVSGKCIYLGEDPGNGGRVYANPGYYTNVPVLDVASMHPSSAIRLKIFGERYTKIFEELVMVRKCIKHKEYDKAKKLFGGKLSKYLDDPTMAKQLSNALKTAINSVYGLTSASFDNKLRDPRNKDNIVAKYGALFMILLQKKVEEKGYKVAHIKTDSIKIADATPEIIQFVMDFGKEYGFEFEHESTYSKFCLVNESVYIAKYASAEVCKELYGYIPKNNEEEGSKWTATGTQFQVPYVFKTLFSKEDIEFKDVCETKSVTSSMYLDFDEGKDQNEHDYHFVGKVGLFCPMKEGSGAGLLLRESTDKEGNVKYDSVVGSKGYRWMEAEMVKTLGKEDQIDYSYYDGLVEEALKNISNYVTYEELITDYDDPEWMKIKKTDSGVIPFAA